MNYFHINIIEIEKYTDTYDNTHAIQYEAQNNRINIPNKQHLFKHSELTRSFHTHFNTTHSVILNLILYDLLQSNYLSKYYSHRITNLK